MSLRTHVLEDIEVIFRRDLRRQGTAGDAADDEFGAVEVEIFVGRHDGYMDSTKRGRAQTYGMWNYGWEREDGSGRAAVNGGRFCGAITRSGRSKRRPYDRKTRAVEKAK